LGKRRSIVLPRGPDGLDLVSYGRRGPSARFGHEQLSQIARTARRVPEVMVKVSGGGREAGAVQAHFAYIGRHGDLEIETDDGRILTGEGAARELVEDWNLDVASGPYRRGRALEHHTPPKRPKDVHNIVLSMPLSTPPKKLLAAAKAFAESQFGGRHRYAMALHTDQKHPHVHLVVKAKSVEGERLYIRKVTLRAWREEFAKELRARGVAANATTRAVRGQTKSPKKTPIHRAAMRGNSTFMQTLARDVGDEIRVGKLTREPGKSTLQSTRAVVEREWESTARRLEAQGERVLAADVRKFAQNLPPPRTEREWVAAGILAEIARRELRERTPNPSGPPPRTPSRSPEPPERSP
jgi:relaxase-like protein